MREAPQAPFSAYNDMRLPDVHALHDLAYDLNLSNFSQGMYVCMYVGMYVFVCGYEHEDAQELRATSIHEKTESTRAD